MKTLLLFPVAGCLLLAGCGDGGGGSSGASSGNPVTAPVDYLGAVGQAQQKAVKTVDLSALNQAIKMFQVEEERLPKDLNELVEKKYLARIPEAPYGKKIVYEPGSGLVKVVAQ